MSRSLLIESLESVAVVYRSSESSNLACNVKGDQSFVGFNSGGVGGVPGGRNSPSL
jgi:hypothetical protein